jgi:uncharacterized phage-associated protein
MTARDVAAELRRRLPGVGTKKLHKLLYYCQGHHLANFDEPLFSETISAWDMGPVVGQLWKEEAEGQADDPLPIVDEAELNTIGYVLSRYGALSGADLEHLTHSEAPWQLANRERPPSGSVRIDVEWIRGYFRTANTAGDEESFDLDPAVVSAWVREAAAHRDPEPRRDSREELLARLGRRG